MTVAERLIEIRARIDDARADSKQEVCLVAVSKRQPEARLLAAYEAGHRDFGENFVQQLLAKQAVFPDARWHAIGHIQTNKAKGAVKAHMIHTIDSERLARAIDRAATGKVRVLIEVNVDQESTKSGVSSKDLAPLIEVMLGLDKLSLSGLMCIPSEGSGRAAFARLRELRDAAESATGVDLPHLSMGMSSDFEDAIREGATIVRVGTALFGDRNIG